MTTHEQDTNLDPKLLARLRSRKAHQRQQAEAEMQRLGPEAVDGLLRLLEKEAGTYRKRRNFGIAVVCAYVLFIAAMAVFGEGDNIGSLTATIGGMMALFAATQTQKNAAGALAQYNDKRAVGPLAEALEYQDKDVVRGAEAALVRLLPALQATDHALLTTAQRRCLDRAMVKRKKTDLTMAALKAYEQVADDASVEIVERIAGGRIRAVRDPKVISRAADALPAMRERADMVRAAQTLLRPAEAGDAETTLLRPASGGPLGPAETLVRPASADAESMATLEDATTAQSAAETSAPVVTRR